MTFGNILSTATESPSGLNEYIQRSAIGARTSSNTKPGRALVAGKILATGAGPGAPQELQARAFVETG
jgi:hypothetical protein